MATDGAAPGITPAATTSATRSSLRALAALVRLPNLFTAPPDVVLGAALATVLVGGSVPVAPLTVGLLALASVLLYAGGTTLNDVVDTREDTRDRPTRPIPSGGVSRLFALRLAVGFLLSGVALALLAAGPVAGAVAGLLALVVVAYDVALKGGPTGFLAMGAARALNVVLGLSVLGDSLSVALAAPANETLVVLAVPLLTLGYVASFTYMASRETEGNNRVAVGVAVVGAAVVALAAPVVVFSLAGLDMAVLAGVLAAGFVVWVGRPLRRAYRRPVPGTVGPAVGACVLGLVLFDAAVALVAGPFVACVVLAHLVPARLLSRLFHVS